MNVLAYATAAAILDGYIQNVILKNPGGESWWTDHNGIEYTDDIGYFLEMWNDIKDALGLPRKDETK